MEGSGRREFLLSKGWLQAVVLVVLVGFSVLGLLAYRTYQASPPVPARVVDPQGQVIYTGTDVSHGQQVFLNHGLMEYGSAFGHGAYLGPDFTADYLRRSADFVRGVYGGPGSDRAAQQTMRDFRTNRYDKRTGVLTLTTPQAEAHRRLVAYYSRYFSDPKTDHGLRPDAITNRKDLRRPDRVLRLDGMGGLDDAAGAQLLLHQQLAAGAARREQADRERDRVVGAVADRAARRHRPAVRRVRALAVPRLARTRAGDAVVPLAGRRGADPGQRATAWFFFVMAALFLIQTLVGAASQHYRADIGSFFGFDLAQVFPYNLMRTWHVQLALFWVATSFVAAGIFLAPMIARREPRGQGTLAYGLLGALAVVVFGTLIGTYLAIHGELGGGDELAGPAGL